MTISTAGICGLDGYVPTYDPDGIWRIWALMDIYMGNQGENKHVPKLNDFVMNTETLQLYKVTSIDILTLIPTLIPIYLNSYSSSDMSSNDILYGVGPGTQADTYRCYLDTSVMPHVLAVDARLRVGGSMSSYAKIFLGTDLSSSGKVISRLYNANGQLLSESIPLELAAIDSHENHTIKVVTPCYTNFEMPNGELVTVVIYNDEGHVISKRQLLIENTSFIRSVNNTVKYITNIQLVSPFISPTMPNIILYPLNVPISALNPKARVWYSDGSYNEYPVDGIKFTILGLNTYVSGIIGQEYDIILKYILGPDEVAIGTTALNNAITAPYIIRTIDPNYSYSAKLFAYPTWDKTSLEYNLRWWLYTLDRRMVYEVTGLVNFSTATGPYKPKLFGQTQNKNVYINLKTVSPSFKPYNHVQNIEITLLHVPGVNSASWLVDMEPDQNQTAYGAGLLAKRSNTDTKSFTIDCGINTLDAWLQKVYYETHPLIDSSKETSAIVPTHMRLKTDGVNIDTQVSYFKNTFTGSVAIPQYSLLTIEFYKRTNIDNIELSIGAMMIV
jgi:hypothetical protein